MLAFWWRFLRLPNVLLLSIKSYFAGGELPAIFSMVELYVKDETVVSIGEGQVVSGPLHFVSASPVTIDEETLTHGTFLVVSGHAEQIGDHTVFQNQLLPFSWAFFLVFGFVAASRSFRVL